MDFVVVTGGGAWVDVVAVTEDGTRVELFGEGVDVPKIIFFQ